MKHIKQLNEMEKVGSLDGFDQLIPKHQLAVCIANGLIEYNQHIKLGFEESKDFIALGWGDAKDEHKILKLWVENDHSYKEYLDGLMEMFKLAGLNFKIIKGENDDRFPRTITILE